MGGGEGSWGRVPARTSCRILSHGAILKSMVAFGAVGVKTWAKMMSRSSWGMLRRVGGIAFLVSRVSWARVDGLWAAGCVVRSSLDAS